MDSTGHMEASLAACEDLIMSKVFWSIVREEPELDRVKIQSCEEGEKRDPSSRSDEAEGRRALVPSSGGSLSRNPREYPLEEGIYGCIRPLIGALLALFVLILLSSS